MRYDKDFDIENQMAAGQRKEAREMTKETEIEIEMIVKSSEAMKDGAMRKILKKIVEETEEYPCIKVKITMT